jgi:hypothetical protein
MQCEISKGVVEISNGVCEISKGVYEISKGVYEISNRVYEISKMQCEILNWVYFETQTMYYEFTFNAVLSFKAKLNAVPNMENFLIWKI